MYHSLGYLHCVQRVQCTMPILGTILTISCRRTRQNASIATSRRIRTSTCSSVPIYSSLVTFTSLLSCSFTIEPNVLSPTRLYCTSPPTLFSHPMRCPFTSSSHSPHLTSQQGVQLISPRTFDYNNTIRYNVCSPHRTLQPVFQSFYPTSFPIPSKHYVASSPPLYSSLFHPLQSHQQLNHSISLISPSTTSNNIPSISSLHPLFPFSAHIPCILRRGCKEE